MDVGRCMPTCLGIGEMLCHIMLSLWNSICALVITNNFDSKNLCRFISRLISLACQQLWPTFGTVKNITFNTPTVLARYENTRDPNCKGIKECEPLRRVRTGTGAGFGQIAKTAKPKSRYLPTSTAGDSATISTGSAQFLIKSLPQKTRNYENSRWTNQT
jgi:hypothetical protein